MARVVAEQGVGSATVARVVAHAGVSRRTFYELFSDCEDCFLAVFEDTLERASRIASEAAGGVSPPAWRAQLRAGLAALLSFFDEDRLSGSLLIVDALGAGPKVLERRARVLDVLIEIVDRGRMQSRHGTFTSASSSASSSSSSSSSPPLTAEGTVGAVLAVIHARMFEDARRPLLELLNPLMGMIVLPYLGQAAAAKERERPLSRPASPRGSSGSAAVRPTPRGAPPRDPLEGLKMRLTYRTLMVLASIGAEPGASNRRVGEAAGIHDQGQISKLLGRLEGLGLIHNNGDGQPRGEPNAWTLTTRGAEVQAAIGT
jgi:AcrR family transcriptional regulator